MSSGEFIVIDESTREILKTISLNLDFHNNCEHVICPTCSAKMYSAFHFRSTCLYVEDKILSYVNSKVSFVDLREVYLNEHENKPSVKMEDDQKICRLCLQLVSEGFVTFYDVTLEMMYRYIPEVNFGITEDPVICRQCFDSLSLHDAFIKTCSDVELKIANVQNNITDFGSSDVFIKSENFEIVLRDEQRMEQLVKIEKEVQAEETVIKMEEVDIKSEENYCKRDSSSWDLHETIEKKMIRTYEDVGEVRNEYMCKKGEIQIDQHETTLDVPSYKSVYISEFHSGLTQENSNCHQLISKDPLEFKMYKCDTCSFQARYRSHLKAHLLSHMDRSEIKMYKCDECDYETKYKKHIKEHQILHLSEIETYKCDACNYETKFKRYLKSHQLMHKDSSEIQMYKCDTCAFETKHKSNLKMHHLLHKDPSKIKMYKCDTCDYENKYRSNVKSHQLTHKGIADIRKYKCDNCAYETKYKYDIRRHQLVHQNPSAVQLYKCGTCPYETKYKGNLKDHQLTHENPSTAQQECVFETKHKQGLNIHVVKQQDLWKGQMYNLYKCDKCVFQTKLKRSLVIHQLMHKNSSG
ncbi:zinc finger protein 710-like [Anoplophora glabripennis]|uniref:zinc finger protein 710-like n=1 Tax=Anoplophora glabripennis TaxID=217634 RepID=UPI000C78483D|nr:zinc finger protein 710-like [Anoplophora glabripennis]